ncbi:MAG: Spo0E like sporulation regulatory protein [Clostridiaceae bacterium]|jgi:hypothetical protein|nr:Spo0E like sporulation regulatory protein [Clostridiaceae bacterium]
MEELREKLIETINIKGINANEVIEISQELDKLILYFMKNNDD